MGYDWQKIFQEKESPELVKIYSGDSHLDYEASIFAGLELKKRKYDFNKIQDIHHRKIAELKSDLDGYKNLKYVNSRFFRQQILNIIALAFFMYALLMSPESMGYENKIEFYYALIIIFTTLIAIIGARWSFKRFKRKQKMELEKRARLLQMLTSD